MGLLNRTPFPTPSTTLARVSNEDTSLTLTLSSAPLVSRLERFHCIHWSLSLSETNWVEESVHYSHTHPPCNTAPQALDDLLHNTDYRDSLTES